MSPLAALLLSSEVHCWQLLRGTLRTIDEDKWNPEVKQTLKDMGFFQLIKITNPPLILDGAPTSNTRFLKFRSGLNTDGEEASLLRKDIEELVGKPMSKFLLYRGLTEAMKNVLNWAYPDETSDTPENLRRWWMSASYNKAHNSLIIMFYDHGVGIPETLPRSSIWEKVRGLAVSNDDHEMIAAAMKVGRSATMENHRGKGLRDIQKFILDSEGGMLKVISGKGEYTINHKGNETKVMLPESIGGTLIAWEVRG